jgi:hypothetical protein
MASVMVSEDTAPLRVELLYGLVHGALIFRPERRNEN